MPNYEDEFPPEQGPFKVGASVIRESFDRDTPSFVVELDFGAFRRAWEIIEEQARTHYPTHETLSTARAELRAVRAFRAAWAPYARHEAIEAPSREVETPRTRRMARRATATPPSPPERQRRKIARASK